MALGVVLALAFGSGVLAFALGGSWVGGIVTAHGVLGLALVALSPWKAVIAARGARRRGPRSTASLLLALTVVATVLTGMAHALGARELGPISAMRLHVGAALLSVPLAAWHLVARPVRPRPTDVSRRALLRGAGVLGAGAGLWIAGEGVSRLLHLPGATRRATGSHEIGSFDPRGFPATIWLNDRVPDFDPTGHLVSIGGVGVPVETLDAGDGVRATIDCTGGWYSVHDWSGVRLDRMLPTTPGRSVLVRSATGFARRLPVGDAAGTWLATRVDGVELPVEHGGPVRLVAPGRRGFWWVKWVSSIEIEDTAWWWQPPFPLA